MTACQLAETRVPAELAVFKSKEQIGTSWAAPLPATAGILGPGG
jgi:hypothetical protein